MQYPRNHDAAVFSTIEHYVLAMLETAQARANVIT
jgi:hypothetical protein